MCEAIVDPLRCKTGANQVSLFACCLCESRVRREIREGDTRSMGFGLQSAPDVASASGAADATGPRVAVAVGLAWAPQPSALRT